MLYFNWNEIIHCDIESFDKDQFWHEISLDERFVDTYYMQYVLRNNRRISAVYIGSEFGIYILGLWCGYDVIWEFLPKKWNENELLIWIHVFGCIVVIESHQFYENSGFQVYKSFWLLFMVHDVKRIYWKCMKFI